MFNRSKEVRIYTEEDILRSELDYLHDGIKPPAEIGSVVGTTFYIKSRAETDSHNAQAREILAKKASADWESSTPKGKPITIFRRVLAR